jgi:hypothetical protein
MGSANVYGTQNQYPSGYPGAGSEVLPEPVNRSGGFLNAVSDFQQEQARPNDPYVSPYENVARNGYLAAEPEEDTFGLPSSGLSGQQSQEIDDEVSLPNFVGLLHPGLPTVDDSPLALSGNAPLGASTRSRLEI